MTQGRTSRLLPKNPIVRKLLLVIGYSTWVVASFILGALLTVAILLTLIQFGLPYAALAETARSTTEAALSFTFAVLIAIGIPYRLFGLRNIKEHLGLTRTLSWFDLLLGTIAVIPYLVLAVIAISIAGVFIPDFYLSEPQDVGFNSVRSASDYMLAFATLVIIAPIAEEVLFRGYFYGGLRKHMGIIVSSIVVSVVFGVLHGQWNVGVNVFALSLVLCALREMTGSIWAGIVLHMVKNAIAFYGLYIATL